MHLPTAHPSRVLRALLLPATCVIMLGLSLAWAQWLTHDTQRWPGQRLTQAVAVATTSASSPLPDGEAGWQAVTLPDNWKVARPAGAASVWYRVPFEPRGIATPAVLIARLATNGRVLLNGSLLWDGQAAGATARSWNAPLLLDLPVALLRASGNELEIQVSGPARLRAGLSQIQLASDAELAPAARSRQFWQHDGAMVSSAVSAVAGLLMLMMWWATKRRDAMYLYFGLSILVWAARNSNLFLDALPLSLDQWAVVVFLGHTWFNALFGLFVLRFCGLRWTWVERALWLFAIGNTLVAASGSLSHIEQAMAIMAAPATLLYLLLVGLLLRNGWRARSVESALMAASTITFVVLSLRDAMLLSSKLPYDGYYISHYTGVLMLVCIVWSLVARLVTALGAVERLNVDLERRVDERTQELQTAMAAKSRFLAAASHDLRQPVAAIGLLVGLLRERGAAGSPGKMVDRIDDAVASLEALLKGLLDLSRLESGTVTPRLEDVALQPLFDSVATHERALAQAQGLRLRWRPTRLAVHTDPVLLEQILRNLVSNGLRHSSRGGVLVTARRRAGDRVLLQVWDTGHGIAPEQQSAVFEEFVQLDNPARERARGLGLGLAIVQRCARILGCSVTLRSRPGRGSCFSLELPGAHVHHVAAATAPLRSDPLAGWQVVVVEDDASVREALRLRIAQWGAEVTEFDGTASLGRALASGRLARADLVVTDNRLAGGGAAQVAEMARRALGNVPVLVVTGDTSPQVISALAASGLPVLHKPFRTEQLLAAMTAAGVA